MSYSKRPPLGQATMANSEPVVLASDQTRINVQLDALQTATTGTITTSSSTVTVTDLAGIGGVTVQISGTYAGVNMTFEASVDGTNWVTIPAQPVLTATPTPVIATGVITANSTLVWNVSPLLGIAQFRVRSTAYTSGTANIRIEPSAQFTQYITSVSTMPTVATTLTSTTLTSVVPGTAATNLGKARDSAAAGTDTGVATLLIRRDVPTAVTPAAGDYEPPQISANGEQWVRLAGELADDSAFTVATTRVVPVGFLADETATDSVDEGDAGAARMTLDRKQVVANYAHTAGGATPYKLVSAATTNATSVKASAGQVYMITASNVNAAARYLKLYNKASAPTVGTDVPVLTLIIPGNTAGAGTNIPVPTVGLAFSTGIAFALTTEATDAGTTAVAASEIVVNLAYL